MQALFLWLGKTFGLPVVKWIGRKAQETVRGSPLDRAMDAALLHAVDEAIRQSNPPDAERLRALVDRGEGADLMAAVVQDVGTSLDVARFRGILERNGYRVQPEAFDARAFLERVRDDFVQRMAAKPASRDAYLSGRRLMRSSSNALLPPSLETPTRKAA